MFVRWAETSKRMQAGLEEIRKQISSLPLQDARATAEHALRDPVRFECAEEAWDGGEIELGLPPLVRQFFGQYLSVVSLSTSAELCRDGIAPVAADSKYLRIGADGEHTHLAVLPGEETVYVLADDVPAEEQVEDTFPSIYHYLAFLGRL
jgi:hypothetical protein